jgi:putative ABC transport system permease protein
LAVVAAMATFGASVSRSATASVDSAINADLLVTGTSSGSGSFSPGLANAVTRVPGVTSSLIVYGGQFEIQGSVESLKGVPVRGLAQTVDLHLTSGSVGRLADGELLIDSTTASSDHLHVGSRVPVRFALTGGSIMRIGGIYQSNALIGSYLVGEGFYLSHYQNPLPGAVLLTTAGGTAGQHVQQAVQRELASSPTVQVQTRAQFEKSQLSSVNQLLGLVYVLLALAVLIAVIGIINALMLSVFERTREIGLLRAVGMKRRQVRTMIRSESVIISTFGTIVGLVIGTGLGTALVFALRLTEIAVPGTSLIVFLILSVLLGLVAATWPARRAARLDVLASAADQ